MDSLGDYVYLIVIIVAALSGFFKNKNKKKLLTPAPSAEVEVEDDYEEVEPEFHVPVQQLEPEPIVEKPRFSTLNSSQESLISYETTTDFNKLKARKDITIHHSTMHAAIEVPPDEQEESIIQLNSVEEARKAFLYAEIFSKKYC